jgi:hypothetical protein
MARTVIQIAANQDRLFALCDDGQIFKLNGDTWDLVAPIPQGGPRDQDRKQKPGFIQVADEPGG